MTQGQIGMIITNADQCHDGLGHKLEICPFKIGAKFHKIIGNIKTKLIIIFIIL